MLLTVGDQQPLQAEIVEFVEFVVEVVDARAGRIVSNFVLGSTIDTPRGSTVRESSWNVPVVEEEKQRIFHAEHCCWSRNLPILHCTAPIVLGQRTTLVCP